MHRVAVIGFGNIGRHVARALSSECAASGVGAVAVLARNGSVAHALPPKAELFTGIDSLLAWKPDLIVETAGQAALREYGPACLDAGVSLVATSVGALADADFAKRLVDLAKSRQCRLIIPAGAVGGLDYLQAVSRFPDAQVIYESRKPPAAWKDELVQMGTDPATLSGPVTLFSGPASTAALRYPKNLNVAATLALAGVGMEDTQVRVMVDPDSPGNQHVVRVVSSAGTFSLQMVNNPSPDNPKTSWIVAESVLASVERYFSPIWIG
jgi:aspartate dehydrogenase